MSVAGIRPITCLGTLLLAIACIAPTTVPAPAISTFIISIPFVGFKLKPPVSYTIPFPTSIIGFLFLAFFGFHSKIENVGSSRLPWFTASKPPILRDCIFFLLNTVVLKPDFLPASCACLAKSFALRCEKGVFTKSFVSFTEILRFSSSLLLTEFLLFIIFMFKSLTFLVLLL